MDTTGTPGIRAVLAEWLAYLRRPHAIAPTGLRAPGSWRYLVVLGLFQVAVLYLVLLPFLQFWQASNALPGPESFGLLPPGWLVPVTVLIAPVLEELLFRGWLTGRLRGLWLLACTVGALCFIAASTAGLGEAAAGLGALALLLAAPIGWYWLRRRPAPQWFARTFPLALYLSALAFALSHLVNYPAVSLLALPMFLPQFFAGLVLGFVRMRIGLAGSILVHAFSNGTILALAALGAALA